jgi:hypothetical protein
MLAYAQLGYDDAHSKSKSRTSTNRRVLAKTVALTDAMTAGGPRELQVLLYPLPRVKRLDERASRARMLRRSLSTSVNLHSPVEL